MELLIPNTNMRYTLSREDKIQIWQEVEHENDINDILTVLSSIEDYCPLDVGQKKWLMDATKDPSVLGYLANVKREFETDYQSGDYSIWDKAATKAIEQYIEENHK